MMSGKKRSKKQKKKLMTMILAVAIVLILLVSSFYLLVSVFYPQWVTVTIVDTTTQPLLGTTYASQVLTSAQSFVVPPGVTEISLLRIDRFELFAGAQILVGISTTLTDDQNQWMRTLKSGDSHNNPTGPMAFGGTGPLSLVNIDFARWAVTSGQTYYVMMKMFGVPGSGSSGRSRPVGNHYPHGMHYTKALATGFISKPNEDLSLRIVGRYEASPPPVPFTPSFSPASPKVGQPVSISTQAVVCPHGSAVQYQFSYGDGKASSWMSSPSVNRVNGYLEPGTYSIRVRARNEYGKVSAYSTGVPITITEDIPVPTTYTVSINIRDQVTNSVIQGATVICAGITKTTGVDGLVSFELQNGQYSAQASKSGYNPNSVSFTVSGAPLTRTIFLTATHQQPTYVTCWKCVGTTPISMSFPSGTVCGQGQAVEYPYSSQPNCALPDHDPDPDPDPGLLSLDVEVYDYSTFNPVANAVVTVNGDSKITDSQGKTSFSLAGSGKVYQVSAEKPGFKVSERTVTLYHSDVTITLYLYADDVTPPVTDPPVETPGFEVVLLMSVCALFSLFVKIRKDQLKKRKR